MLPRWKGKIAKAKALADPMSKIVSQLQCSLIKADACGLLSGCTVLLAVEVEQTDLLNRSCFGRPIVNTEKDNVAKTLLILHINTNDKGASYPSCLEAYFVEERTITRWSPEQCREDHTVIANGTKARGCLSEVIDDRLKD
ncbi:tRNA-splicing endonuclease subunit Sen2-1 [Tripterygium wilfordii]|uniref:tRNA-splicing endonuclease subunit Sen2-1 n=1 Tax=Tripterygium wilfordii TaxID=458696 RepID=A0A7J7DE90_TRIWF|nr:tRNA-splicing endonuclease subunit Sen2-1 [Tripterygium wilfordii]